jgi:hypothetical protein
VHDTLSHARSLRRIEANRLSVAHMAAIWSADELDGILEHTCIEAATALGTASQEVGRADHLARTSGVPARSTGDALHRANANLNRAVSLQRTAESIARAAEVARARETTNR